jgi:hypothetical protein
MICGRNCFIKSAPAECTCNLDGIISNDGCNQETGDCTCKRFVVGRDCDQCQEEHYGLSASGRCTEAHY